MKLAGRRNAPSLSERLARWACPMPRRSRRYAVSLLALGLMSLACGADGQATGGVADPPTETQPANGTGIAAENSAVPTAAPSETPTTSTADTATLEQREAEAETVPDAAPEAEAEVVPEPAPESDAETVPDAAPEAEAEVVPEPAPESDAETVPDAAPEAEAEVVPEPAPESDAETVPDAAPEAEAEVVPEPAPESDAETVPDAASDPASSLTVGPSLIQDENPGVFLTEENTLSRFIRNTIVEQYSDQNPWLVEAWSYTNREDFVYRQVDDPSIEIDRPAAAFVGTSAALDVDDLSYDEDPAFRQFSYGVDKLEMVTRHDIVEPYNWNIAIHEMAHIYTLARDVAREQSTLAIAHLYFDGLSQSHSYECTGYELLADAAKMLVDTESHHYSYWVACPDVPEEPTPEAEAIVRDAFAGVLPQWFYDTFEKVDGTLDYEGIWTAVEGLDDYWTAVIIIRQLKDAFGGYCSHQAAVYGYLEVNHFSSGMGTNLKQPWRDGGC